MDGTKPDNDMKGAGNSAKKVEWALILGGSSGLGLATAKKLARHGFHLIIVHRDRRADLDQIQMQFQEITASGVRLLAYNIDASHPEKRKSTLQEVQETLGEDGQIKLLVHSIAKGSLKPMKKIRIGIAGLGFIGPVHLEALRRISGVEVVSVYHNNDDVQTKAEQLGVTRYYQDYDEFLAKDALDCVHICTPNFLHFEMAQKALSAGLHVVCEKPLAITIPEAEVLLRLAREKNAVHVQEAKQTNALGQTAPQKDAVMPIGPYQGSGKV